MDNRSSPLIEWIHAHSTFEGEACLFWPYHGGNGKYPTVPLSGKTMTATRYMCIVAHGEPPSPEHEAAHSCGQGSNACFNQKHLRWATRKENEQDKRAHGTHGSGEKNSQAKLTEQQAIQIIEMVRSGHSQRSVAQAFGMHPISIHYIVKGRLWPHLQEKGRANG